MHSLPPGCNAKRIAKTAAARSKQEWRGIDINRLKIEFGKQNHELTKAILTGISFVPFTINDDTNDALTTA